MQHTGRSAGSVHFTFGLSSINEIAEGEAQHSNGCSHPKIQLRIRSV